MIKTIQIAADPFLPAAPVVQIRTMMYDALETMQRIARFLRRVLVHQTEDFLPPARRAGLMSYFAILGQMSWRRRGDGI